MMQPRLATAETRTGRAFKVYVWKQHSRHFMDWNGCNYRLVSVPGQPPRGFKTREEAAEWGAAWLRDGGDVFHLARLTDGTHLSDNDTRTVKPIR